MWIKGWGLGDLFGGGVVLLQDVCGVSDVVIAV